MGEKTKHPSLECVNADTERAGYMSRTIYLCTITSQRISPISHRILMFRNPTQTTCSESKTLANPKADGLGRRGGTLRMDPLFCSKGGALQCGRDVGGGGGGVILIKYSTDGVLRVGALIRSGLPSYI